MSKPQTEIVKKEIVNKEGVKETINYLHVLPEACKTCKTLPRRQASSYCQPCSDAFKGVRDSVVSI